MSPRTGDSVGGSQARARNGGRTASIRLIGTKLPGRVWEEHDNVHVGIQRRSEVIDLVAGDAAEARFTASVQVEGVNGGPIDLRGPYIHGGPGERFLYLSWGNVAVDGTFSMFRRAKIWVNALPCVITEVLYNGGTVEGRLRLTDERGGPLCASVPDADLRWSGRISQD